MPGHVRDDPFLCQVPPERDEEDMGQTSPDSPDLSEEAIELLLAASGLTLPTPALTQPTTQVPSTAQPSGAIDTAPQTSTTNSAGNAAASAPGPTISPRRKARPGVSSNLQADLPEPEDLDVYTFDLRNRARACGTEARKGKHSKITGCPCIWNSTHGKDVTPDHEYLCLRHCIKSHIISASRLKRPIADRQESMRMASLMHQLCYGIPIRAQNIDNASPRIEFGVNGQWIQGAFGYSNPDSACVFKVEKGKDTEGFKAHIKENGVPFQQFYFSTFELLPMPENRRKEERKRKRGDQASSSSRSASKEFTPSSSRSTGHSPNRSPNRNPIQSQSCMGTVIAQGSVQPQPKSNTVDPALPSVNTNSQPQLDEDATNLLQLLQDTELGALYNFGDQVPMPAAPDYFGDQVPMPAAQGYFGDLGSMPTVSADFGAQAYMPAASAGFGEQASMPALSADFGAQAYMPAVSADFGAQAYMPAVSADFGAQAYMPAASADFGAQAYMPAASAGFGEQASMSAASAGSGEQASMPAASAVFGDLGSMPEVSADSGEQASMPAASADFGGEVPMLGGVAYFGGEIIAPAAPADIGSQALLPAALSKYGDRGPMLAAPAAISGQAPMPTAPAGFGDEAFVPEDPLVTATFADFIDEAFLLEDPPMPATPADFDDEAFVPADPPMVVSPAGISDQAPMSGDLDGLDCYFSFDEPNTLETGPLFL